MRQPAGRAERRNGGERKPREQRWAELIEVATEVFFEKGYEAASLQDIADRLGMLKGSLYYYIHSKEDLLYDVISAVHQAGLANIESLAGQDGDALQRLHNVIVGHLEHECHNLTRTAVFLHELQALPPRRREAIIGEEHAYRGVFSHLIEEGQREGSIREDVDPKLGALSMLGSINWVYRWFRQGGEFTPRQIGEQFADLIIRGLASESALPLSTRGPTPAAGRRAATKKAASQRSRNTTRARTA